MIKIKNRCCYTVTLILCGTLFLTGLTGCKSREAQFLIEGLQEAKAEVDAESSEEKTSGQKSKKDTDEKKADTEDRQNDSGNSAEFRKKQAESDGSDAGNGTGSDSGKHTSDADIDNGSEAVSHHLLPKLSCSFGSPYPTTISSFIFAKVPSLIPCTFIISSIAANGPFSSL